MLLISLSFSFMWWVTFLLKPPKSSLLFTLNGFIMTCFGVESLGYLSCSCWVSLICISMCFITFVKFSAIFSPKNLSDPFSVPLGDSCNVSEHLLSPLGPVHFPSFSYLFAPQMWWFQMIFFRFVHSSFTLPYYLLQSLIQKADITTFALPT